jgi:DNA-binding beta-propeller fold protein YncE
VRKTILSSLTAVILAGVPACLQAQTPLAASSASPAETLSISKVSLPGDGRGDYLVADGRANRLFVTHSGVVHVLDLKTLKPVAEVSGLTAAHGVALDSKGRAYVTDGGTNSVVEFDPATGRVLKRIAVGEKPDSILFDPASSKIMAFDGDSEEVSVIEPATGTVVATIKLPNAPEYSQTDGRGHVYVNLEEGNAVAVIDTAKMKLDHLISLTGCDGPAPLALANANRRLFSGCGNNVMVVTDADSGKVLASVPIGGDPDGIVYDGGTKRIFVANRDGGWTIVSQKGADQYQVEQTLKIDEYAKTVALDPKTHRVFSSTADLIWPPAVPGKKHLPNAKPGTFRLLVVSQL